MGNIEIKFCEKCQGAVLDGRCLICEYATLEKQLEVVRERINLGWAACEDGDPPTLEQFLTGLDAILQPDSGKGGR